MSKANIKTNKIKLPKVLYVRVDMKGNKPRYVVEDEIGKHLNPGKVVLVGAYDLFTAHEISSESKSV